MNGKGGFLSPYMGGQNYEPPTGLIKLAYPPSAAVNGAVGLPTPVLMRIPEYGDTISALTRRAKETTSLNALRWNSEMNESLAVA